MIQHRCSDHIKWLLIDRNDSEYLFGATVHLLDAYTKPTTTTQKAPVIANEGFANLVAQGGIERAEVRMPDPAVTFALAKLSRYETLSEFQCTHS
jgi:hypothetical protein